MEYLDNVEQYSQMCAILLDGEWHYVAGHGVPAGAENALAAARATGHTRFQVGFRWRGAAVVPTPKGDFVLVAQVIPLRGLLTASEFRIPAIRLSLVLLSGGLLSLLLARI